MTPLNYEQLASEFLRAVRGKRSQTAFSRRLGYQSNVSYTWESGRRWPTAAVLLFGISRTGIDVRNALSGFLLNTPQWLESGDPTSPEAVAALLRDLRGGTPILDLAARTGRSRFAVARWLKGTAEPRVPDFLRMIEGSSLRMLDFIAVFTDPAGLPAAARDWRRLEAARTMAVETPWAPAVLLSLELADYQALKHHERGWIARRIGIGIDIEERCLTLLAEAGHIRMSGSRWIRTHIQAVDTRRPTSSTELKEWWGAVSLDRLSSDRDGLYSFNLCTVSEADFQRIQELQRAYYRSLRAIVAESTPSERLILTNLHLAALDATDPV